MFKEINVKVECYVCGTVFIHDANYEDAYCTGCGEFMEISGEYQTHLIETARVK